MEGAQKLWREKLRGIITADVLQDWALDADIISDICCCTRAGAMRAIIKLRAIELDLDLSPLIRLFDEEEIIEME